jgi:hypothetical protein
MAFPQGGTPHTVQITIGTTPTLILIDRTPSTVSSRSAAIMQQAGTVKDITLGGSAVVAGQGYILRANPDTTSQPNEFVQGSTQAALYGIVASGTGTVTVYEEY